jgi:hypothetical protein
MATPDPSVEIRTEPGTEPGGTLVGGAANSRWGLTGLDYLVAHALTEQVDHVATRNVTDIDPFTAGDPRYRRVHTTTDRDVTPPISESFVPLRAGSIPTRSPRGHVGTPRAVDPIRPVEGVL